LLTHGNCFKIQTNSYLFHYGYDKKYRPVIYLILGKDKLENNPDGQLLKVRVISTFLCALAAKLLNAINWLVVIKM